MLHIADIFDGSACNPLLVIRLPKKLSSVDLTTLLSLFGLIPRSRMKHISKGFFS